MDDKVYRCDCGNEVDAVRVDREIVTTGSKTVVVRATVRCGQCDLVMRLVDRE